MMNFGLLNNDCLEVIFRYMTLMERLRLESVCRKWRKVMPYEDISRLIFNSRNISLAVCNEKCSIIWPEKCLSQVPDYADDYSKAVTPCRLRDALAHILSRCGTYLLELRLSDSEFLDSSNFSLVTYFCPNIRKFTATGTKLHVNCVHMLQQLSKLQHVELNVVLFLNENMECDVTSVRQTFGNVVAALPHIACVKLDQTSLINGQLNGLAFVPHLRSDGLKKLHFSANSDSMFTETENIVTLLTGGCRNIQSLSVYYKNGTVPDCRAVANLEFLQELHLSIDSHTLSSGDLEIICRHCSRISILSLVNFRLEDVDFGPLRWLENLKRLYLWGLYSVNFTDSNLIGIAKNQILEHLSLSSCSLSDAGLENLAKFCGKLTSIDIEGIELASENAICKLVEHCPKLESIVLEIPPADDPPYFVTSKKLLQSVGAYGNNLKLVDVQGYGIEIDESGFYELLEMRGDRISSGQKLPDLVLNLWPLTFEYPLSHDLVENLRSVAKVKFNDDHLSHVDSDELEN